MGFKASKNIYDSIIVFALLFLSVSFVVTNDIISSAATIGLWLLVLMAIVLTGGIHIIYNLTIITISLLALMLFTTLIRQENFLTYIKIMFSVITVSIFVANTSFKRFAQAYVKVMKFLSAISLLGYGFHLIVPSVFNRFIVQNRAGVLFSNYILYVQRLSSGQIAFRNSGFAWEPGAFATFICFAMLLDVMIVSKKIRIKTVFLYVVTVFTTFSTMGIITVLCLCVYITAVDRTLGKGTKRAIIMALMFLVLLIICFSDVLFDLNTSSAFGKIIRFFNEDDHSKSSSTSVRFYSITKAFAAFLRSPLYGWGYEGLAEQTRRFTKGMNTCTFVNWFAVYGALFGTIMLNGVIRFTRYLADKKMHRLMMVAFLFAITASEDYVNSSMIFMIVLYGYLAPNISKETEERIPNEVRDEAFL